VAYCSTEEMVADFFTKPLQGVLFRKFRDQIMNVDPETDWSQDHRSVLESNFEITQNKVSATTNTAISLHANDDENTWSLVKRSGPRTSIKS
jgi:hypothetical protein